MICHCDVLCFSLGNDRLLRNACSPASSSCSSSSPLPKMTGDGEGIHTHSHCFRRDCTKLLPVWTVFVDGLHLGGANCPWAYASQSYELLGVWVHGVNTPELAAGITEEDEEVVGRTLLHFLRLKEGARERKKTISLYWWCAGPNQYIGLSDIGLSQIYQDQHACSPMSADIKSVF